MNIHYSATSTDVKRAFLCGGLTVLKMRHSLSDESTCAATVLSSWHNIPNLILYNEIVSEFKDKGKCSKGKGKVREVDGLMSEIVDLDMDIL